MVIAFIQHNSTVGLIEFTFDKNIITESFKKIVITDFILPNLILGVI